MEFKAKNGIFIDPQTRKRIIFMPHIGDFTYDRSGDEAVVNEDVPVIGAWSDWTGSGGVPTRTQMQFSVRENSLQGTEAHIENNAKVPNLSSIGTRTGTNRRRVIKPYVTVN